MQPNEGSGVSDPSPSAEGGSAVHRRIHRAQYLPPAYLVDRVDLRFDLAIPVTRVTTTLSVTRAADAPAVPLVLNGDRLRLVSLALNAQPLAPERYSIGEHGVTVFDPPHACDITTVVEVHPADNPGLEGLNYAAGVFFTHCEPEGFRKITYFPDRPDILARYRCTLVADAAFPVLLSNGYMQEAGTLPDGRRFVRWQDPFPKASYLFALAAGRFAKLADHFVTSSGRRVELAVHAQPDDLPFCRYGLAVLKQAMAWDEQAYGREFDLDEFNIVVMRSYPGGAMECKGLNLYTSEFFLAAPTISTDEDLLRVAATVAHEYFHNWSGNRVGCRDWFELSLKEGFTVFRQQQFMAALLGPTAERVDEVIRLRELQFPEDEGGMAHAVRPDSYLAINNFYTRTVYEKGAELIRMMSLLVGERAFRAAAEEFFGCYDGRAATIDSFMDTIERVSGADLVQFRKWYDFVGRPLVDVRGTYDAQTRRYTLMVRQCGSNRDASAAPLHMPLRFGLIGRDGKSLPLQLVAGSRAAHCDEVLQLRSELEVFAFEDVAEAPVPSIFRGFCAPIQLSVDLDDDALALLATRDVDGVNRWSMAQELATRVILRSASASGNSGPDAETWFRVVADTLASSADSMDLAGRILCLPSVQQLAQSQRPVDIDGLIAARATLARETTGRFRPLLRRVRAQIAPAAEEEGSFHARKLRNVCLWYLMQNAQSVDVELCRERLLATDAMEDIAAALQLLVDRGGADRDEALRRCYERWRAVPSALDRWFSVQAASAAPDCAQRVERLRHHPAFRLENASRVKAIFDAFTANPAAFHEPGGLGYTIVVELVLALNRPNPRLAARFLKRLDGGYRLDPIRRERLIRSLERVIAAPGLAKDLYEIATQSLACAAPGAQ